MEEWKAVVGYEGIYEVSNLGNVKRIKAEHGATVGRILNRFFSRANYPRVSLSKNSITERPFLHKIVADAFLGKRPNGKEINHKDSNRHNSALVNLEYVTRSQNCHHSIINHRRCNDPHGEQKWGHKLTDLQVREILLSKVTRRKLAIKYGVCHRTISNIINKKTWKHIVISLGQGTVI